MSEGKKLGKVERVIVYSICGLWFYGLFVVDWAKEWDKGYIKFLIFKLIAFGVLAIIYGVWSSFRERKANRVAREARL
jgi:hypothetical protein